LDEIFQVCVPLAAGVDFGRNLVLNLGSEEVKDLSKVLGLQSFTRLIFVEEEQSHPKAIGGQHVFVAVVEREVPFVDLELSRLAARLLVFLQALVGYL